VSARAGGPPQLGQAARNVLRTVLIVLLVIGVLYLIYLLRTPLSWLVLAAFLAIALSGPVNLLNRHMPRGLAIALAYLGLVLIPIGLAAIVLPPVVREVSDLAKNAPHYVTKAQDWINHNHTLHKLDRQYHFGAKLQEKARTLPSHLTDAASALTSVGGAVVSSLFAAFNIVVLSIFMVVSGRRWVDRAIATARPEHAPRIERVVDRIGVAVGNYVGGALLQATIAGVTSFVVLSILGVPFAAPLAVVYGIFDLIPLVGATLAAILVGVVTAFHDFPLTTIIWAIWAVVYQQIENNLIQPQIQRRAVDIHPFAVIISVLFGATLFGIVGALLAIPFAASAEIAVREWWEYRSATAVELPPGVELPEPREPPEPPGPFDLTRSPPPASDG
jgi:predicted PurR-regulated permease PerM